MKFILLGVIQNSEGIKIISIRVDSQFNDKFILEEGSNIENKLVIIFN